MEVNEYNSAIEEVIKVNKDDPTFEITCTKIGKDICSSNLTILDLVEQLGTLLVDTSPEKRENGLLILTKVLENLPSNFLNSDQVKFVSAFYADRLKDHHSVVPVALKGALIISEFDNISGGCFTQILHTFFQNISCQQQQQADRFTVYKMFDKMLEKRLDELQSMSYDFVYGVISAIDGERDPRNLLYIFSWLPKFIRSVTLGHLTEEMFEVVACYFPVDFKAPSDDIHGIRRDDLARALCPCLCCIEDFAQFCLPLVLEKLSSSLKIAKLDSLDLLNESFNTFSSDIFSKHSAEIWSLLQREVLDGTDAQIVKKSLETLRCLISKLSQSESTTGCFKQTIRDIIDTLKGNLIPDTKMFTSSFDILHSVGKASEKSANYVTQGILPQLVNTYNITTTPSNQANLLKCIVELAKVYVEMTGNNNILQVQEFVSVPNLCLNACLSADVDLKRVGLLSVGDLAESLPKELREYIYELINTNITGNGERLAIREAAVISFKKLLKFFPMEVEDNILDKISIQDDSTIDQYLDALCAVGLNNSLSENIVNIFARCCITADNLHRFGIAVKNFRKFVTAYKIDASIYPRLLSDRGSLVDYLVDLPCRNFDETEVEDYEVLCEDIVGILENVVGTQEIEVQKVILKNFINPKVDAFKNSKNSILIISLHGLLCRLRKEISNDLGILPDLCEVTLKSNVDFIFRLGTRLIANMVNKLQDEKALKHNMKIIENIIDTDKKNLHKKNILFFSWLIKALIMRDHEYGFLYLDKLINILETQNDAALGFEILMKDNCSCLGEDNYCIKRLLYRQKLFTKAIEKLCGVEKEQYLYAMGYLLKETPKQLIILHFKKLLKSLILCLERIDDIELLCSILQSLYKLLVAGEIVFDDYVEEFLPRFLNLSRFEKSMKVRIKALMCLQGYTEGYTLHKLLPFKQTVIYELQKCLDDPKRIVRSEAVLARNRWFLLDSPT